MRDSRRVQVVRVDLDDLRDISVGDEPAERALAVVTLGGRVIAEAEVPAAALREQEALLAALAVEVGEPFWLELLRAAIARAMRGSPRPRRPADRLRAAVVVEASARPVALASCLESLRGLESPPEDVLVVGGGRSGARICRAHEVEWIPERPRELERAILSGESAVVAFTNDRCTFDRRWLDDLDQAFFDPLVMAVAGYVGPAALEGDHEVAFHRRAWAEQQDRPAVVDGPAVPSPVRAAVPMRSSGGLFFRRRVLAEVGVPMAPRPAKRWAGGELYALYRVLRAGFRIAYDPGRIAWRRYPRTALGLQRTLAREAASRAGYGCLCLVWHGEPGAARLLAECFTRPLRRQARPSTAAAELVGAAAGVLAALGTGRPRTPRTAAADPFLGLEPTKAAGSGSARDPQRLSVVVPSFNRRALLRRVLDALEAQDYPSERYEVVVVLDGSTDGSEAMVRTRRPPHALRLVGQDNRGLAAARNAGARTAAEPLLVFLDDDIVPERGFLAAHARAHEQEGPGYVAVGACVSVVPERRLWALLRRTWWEDHFTRKAEPDHPWTALDYSAGNSSISKELFFSCGAFDERFERRNEEQELGVRLVATGARFGYHRSARGLHHFQGRFPGALAEHRAQAVADILLARKHPALRSRVTVTAYARDTPYGLSRRAYLAYRRVEALTRLVPLAMRLVDASEALKLRRTYRLLTGWLMAHAYLTGMKDVLGSHAAALPVLRHLADEKPSIVLRAELGASQRSTVPPDASNVAIRVTFRGRPLCESAALEPAREWSWDEVVDRLAFACLPVAKELIALDDLVRVAAPPEVAA